MVGLAVLGVMFSSIVMATLGVQTAFVESQLMSQLNLRAQIALDRIVELASQALTTDAQFAPLKPATGIGSHCLRFRLVQAIDPSTGGVIYNDAAIVYLYGPDTGTDPNRGLIIGRGPSLTAIHGAAAGADGLLGTADDITSATFASDALAVELLVPDVYAPQAGDMFAVTVSPAPVGRLLTFTLRMNARGRDGGFVLPTDLVLTQRVALRQ